MRYIDLTYELNNETSVSPYDSKVIVERVKFLHKDEYNDSKISTTMHIGTHIDAPSHMLDSHKMISSYDISKFIGKGVVLDFENQIDITLREEDKNNIVEDSIVLIYTNMDKNIASKDYYEKHPVISIELCKYLIEKKVKILALDFYSPDQCPFSAHKLLLGNDILIVENIKDAHLLKGIDDLMLYMIPIKIDTEGSFVRAFASTNQ